MPETRRDAAGVSGDDRSSEGAHPHRAQDVRQGEVILRTRRRRWIFFGGLVAAVVLALAAATLAP